MKYLILLFVAFHFVVKSQIPYFPFIINSPSPWSSGSIPITNVDKVILSKNTINNAEVDIKASEEILIIPTTEVKNLFSSGFFHASIEPNGLNPVSFHPSGWNIPKYDKFELGITIPSTIQTQIDAFLSGGIGLNPYDPNQVQVECIYTASSGTYKRYGFYYRDFMTQNNEWIETPTNYKFRIRFAPPTIGTYGVIINLLINGIITESVSRVFYVTSSGNPGHLKMANGNLRKMKFENGSMFFALGQNIPYAIPTLTTNCAPSAYDCITPYSFNKQREFMQDLANNGGNFVRIRLDVLNMLAEWRYKKFLASDPSPNLSIPLNKYLTNYNDNQRYLWELDKTFSLMEGQDLYCMLSILNDQSFTIDGGYDPTHIYTWNNNPYNTITGNNLAGCKAFFINPLSKATYQKWLYYLSARYGYSTRLGVLEMINETNGLANSNSTSAPYQLGTSFATDVTNWICDMTYYLDNFYPWHPKTNGNPYEPNVPVEPCLNIWSKNYYSNFIQNTLSFTNYGKYADANEGRFNDQAKVFYNSYKPFIFGELGFSDSSNCMDKHNDRQFHNTLWATAMMGGIGSGLYWNDWAQEGGIPHRQNFQAIKNFFTNNVDLNRILSPQYDEDKGFGAFPTLMPLNKRWIHTYTMVTPDNEYAVGWTQNNSSNWTADFNSPPIGCQTIVLINSKFDGNVVTYQCLSNPNHPEIKISGLKKLKRYKVSIYDTYSNGALLETRHETTNAFSTLRFRRYMPNGINIGDSFNPDYAFILEYDSFFSRNGAPNTSDTLDITEADTLCLDPDFITEDISNYSYHWDFGNGTTSTDSMPCTHYTKEGTYLIEATAKNLITDSVIRVTKKVIIINNLFSQNNIVLAAPNPAINFIYLTYNIEVLQNPIISLFNVLGQEQFMTVNNNIINIEHLETGIYFIKFKTINYEQIIKISIQH